MIRGLNTERLTEENSFLFQIMLRFSEASRIDPESTANTNYAQRDIRKFGIFEWKESGILFALIERFSTMVYLKGSTAHEVQSCTRSTTVCSRGWLCFGTRRIFASVSPRVTETIRVCVRADWRRKRRERKRNRKRKTRKPTTYAHTRAPSAQVIRAISSKFRSNKISRVVVSVPARLVHKPAEGLSMYACSPR